MQKYVPVPQPVEYCNEDLFNRYNNANDVIARLDNEFDLKNEREYEQNYLSYYMAKLAYCFAKEEKRTLYDELVKRGLIA
ncbi:MAG: hypothetical protein LBU94_01040 [Clostridiales bacterium]|jgi:hypothetical protein|nr:hypothetical protein [Clostridiales bacterium]